MINQSFTIDAKTCTFKINNQTNGGTILNEKIRFIIPIYQRPYSWTEVQIRKFISDIFQSYWGSDGNIIEDPMFIGTMQLSKLNDKREQEVIDGQQRLTTFLVLFKILKQKFPLNESLCAINFDWLQTRVNNGKQQDYLDEFLKSDLEKADCLLNPYFRNGLILKEVIEDEIRLDLDNNLFDSSRFILYLISKVYFVVIETYAGLSKTLQIFNSINTTGLDLNGGDIFKIRMYEYLTSKRKYGELAFEEISKLYEKIDEYNRSVNSQIIDIRGVLSIYQYLIIAKYNLPLTLYSFATDTFFERLFDTIFKINLWEHFRGNIDNIELSIEEIDKIIEIRFEWERMNYPSAESACAMHFLWMSRYSRYEVLVFLYLFNFKGKEADYSSSIFVFLKQLSKLYTIYSILFLKGINEIHTFTYSLIKDMLDLSSEDIIKTINNKIGIINNRQEYADLTEILNGELVYSAKVKNIVCRLSAMLDEKYNSCNKEEIEDIQRKLFGSSIDIEHIQSYLDINEEKREDILNEWGSDINSIGNLMVLEQDKNRSLHNNPYEIKTKVYLSSVYCIVKNQAVNYNEWTLGRCKERKQLEADKILKYLFN